ncbi:DUF7847 domain-containing protein [Halomicrobium urmianum]|uniref:DUF7847 domain-containing protein n=1 Tax=Halomicrobium urmianum TaxID=1586233 RepID=UPI001CDA0F3B|nr:hypothetical protein [Halomicrobium urmianum]
MAVIDALRRTPSALARNPILVVVFGLFALVQAPQLLAQAVSPVVAGLLSLALTGVLLLVTPFVQAGTMQMADDALDGRTSLRTFVAAGKEHYLSVLGAYLVVFGVSFVLGAVGFVVAIFGGIALGAGGGASTGSLIGLGLVVGVILLAYLAFAFLVQFYAQEIVLNGASAIESLRQSAGLVRRNVLSTAGYFVVVMGGSLVVGGGIGVASTFLLPAGTQASAATPPLSAVLLYTVVYVVGIALLGSLFAVYAVAFWRELRSDASGRGSADGLAA